LLSIRVFHEIKLPRIKGMRMDKVTTFEEYDIDTRTIPYLNKAREKARQLRILKKQKGKEERLRNKTGEDEDVVAGDDNGKNVKAKGKSSLHEEHRERVEEIKEIRSNKRRKMAFEDLELEELMREEHLLKKLKKGMFSNEFFLSITRFFCFNSLTES